MCACLTLDRAEVTSQRTCSHMSVNAVFFLHCIHPVRLQCDIRKIYTYFPHMHTNTRAVCTRPPFFVGGLGTRLDWTIRPPHYYAHTNSVTIIVPSQSCLLSFLHHPYMWPFSICKIFHLLVQGDTCNVFFWIVINE